MVHVDVHQEYHISTPLLRKIHDLDLKKHQGWHMLCKLNCIYPRTAKQPY